MACIKIGDVTSLTAESFEWTTDDRQQIIEIEGGNVVQDYGHIASGDKATVNATFYGTDFTKVWKTYETRELVDVTDPAGIVWPSCRVRVVSWGYFDRFEKEESGRNPSAVSTKLEIWRI